MYRGPFGATVEERELEGVRGAVYPLRRENDPRGNPGKRVPDEYPGGGNLRIRWKA